MNFQILRCGLYVFVIGLLAYSPNAVRAQNPGEKLLVPFAPKGEPSNPVITLQFQYCPEGYLGTVATDATGDDLRKYAPDSLHLPGFWVAQTELSQGHYNKIRQLAESIPESDRPALPAMDELLKRGKRWRDPRMGEALKLEGFADDKKPVLCLTLDDCIGICAVLRATAAGKSDGGPASQAASVVKRVFRIPSFAEWQYACRGVSSADDPSLSGSAVNSRRHFHAWPENAQEQFQQLISSKTGGKKLMDELLPDDAAKLRFRATQDDVIELIDRVSRDDMKLKNIKLLLFVLHTFLKGETGFTAPFGFDMSPSGKEVLSLSSADWFDPTLLQRVDSAKDIHPWHLYHLQGNVREWCLNSSDGEAAWEQIVAGESADVTLRLAGGGFKDTTVNHFVIWGGATLSHEQAIDPNEMQRHFPGIRLAMFHSVSIDWIHLVRNLATKRLNGQSQATDVLAEYEGVRRALAGQVGSNKDASSAFLEFYDDLVRSDPGAASAEKWSDAFTTYGAEIESDRSQTANLSAAFFDELAALAR